MDASIAFIREAPTFLSLIALFFSAILEYVFPPVPGDTFALVGGILAGQDALPIVGVVLALTAGSTVGGLISFAAGRAVATKPWAREKLGRLLPDERLAKLERLFDRYGRWVVVANRFLPGLRAYVLVGAGMGRMQTSDIVIFGGISALFWNAAIVGAGIAVGENLDLLLGWVRQYTVAAWIVMGAAVGTALVVKGMRKWRASKDDP